jgi:hypothetical protein
MGTWLNGAAIEFRCFSGPIRKAGT